MSLRDSLASLFVECDPDSSLRGLLEDEIDARGFAPRQDLSAPPWSGDTTSERLTRLEQSLTTLTDDLTSLERGARAPRT